MMHKNLGGGTLGLTLVVAALSACQKKSDRVCDWSQSRGLSVEAWSGERLGDNELSLIFLKGPSEHTRDLIELLGDQSIQASFFVQGSAVEEYEDVLQDMVAAEAGHLIGNGGYRFRNLAEAKEPVLELRTTDALISPLIADNRYLFYAPEKAFNQNIATQLKYNGLSKYVGPIKDDTKPSDSFRYDVDCWANNTSIAACALQYEEEIQRLGRGIIAFHDTSEATVSMLQTLLPSLQNSGYSFKRVDEVNSIAAVLPASAVADQTAPGASCQDY